MARSSVRGGREEVDRELKRLESIIDDEEGNGLDPEQSKRAQKEYLARKEGRAGSTKVNRIGGRGGLSEVECASTPRHTGHSDPPPPASPSPAVRQDGPKIPPILSDIVERRPPASRPQAVRKTPSASGFPKTVHRSHFMKKAQSQATVIQGEDKQDLDQMRTQIDLENRQKITMMTRDEIAEEKASIESQLDPTVLEMLSRRAKGRQATKPTSTPSKTTTPPNPDPENLAHYFPGLEVERAKLAWMGDVEPTPKSSTTTSSRYDLSGRLMTPEKSLETPTSQGLHHHGDEPEKAGYTLQELVRLSRSSNLSQKKMALIALGKIGQSIHRAVPSSSTCHDFCGILPNLFLSLRIDLDDRTPAVINLALTTLLQLLGPERLCDYDTFDGSVLQYDEADTVGRHLDAIGTDAIAGLVRAGLLASLFRLSSSEDETIKSLSLLLLIRCSNHSQAVAEKIWDSGPFWRQTIEPMIKVNWPLPSGQSNMTALALEFTRNLAHASRRISKELVASRFDVTIMRFLVRGDSEEVLVLAFEIMTIFYRYGLATNIYVQASHLFERLDDDDLSGRSPSLHIAHTDFATAVLRSSHRPHEIATPHGIDRSMTGGLVSSSLRSVEFLAMSKDDILSPELMLSLVQYVAVAIALGTTAQADLLSRIAKALFERGGKGGDVDLEEGLIRILDLSFEESDEVDYCGLVKLGNGKQETLVIKLRFIVKILITICETVISSPESVRTSFDLGQLGIWVTSFLHVCDELFEDSPKTRNTVNRYLPLTTFAEKCSVLLQKVNLHLDTKKRIQLVSKCTAYSSGCNLATLTWLMNRLSISLKQEDYRLMTMMYSQSARDVQKTASTLIEETSSVLPIGPNWSFRPLDALLLRDDVFLKSLEQIPVSQDDDDAEIEVDEVRLVSLTLKLVEALSKSDALDPAVVMIGCMKVFMLEKDQDSSSEQEVFRNPGIVQTMERLLSRFERRNSCTREGSTDLQAAVSYCLPKGASFLQFCLDALDLFAAISLGSRTFAKLVVLPLSVDGLDSEYRRAFWTEHAGTMQSIQLECDDALTLSSDRGLECYLHPLDGDMATLTAMVRALTTRRISRQGQPLLYFIAARQVSRALDKGSSLSARRQASIRAAIGNSSEGLSKDLEALQNYPLLYPPECYG